MGRAHRAVRVIADHPLTTIAPGPAMLVMSPRGWRAGGVEHEQPAVPLLELLVRMAAVSVYSLTVTVSRALLSTSGLGGTSRAARHENIPVNHLLVLTV